MSFLIQTLIHNSRRPLIVTSSRNFSLLFSKRCDNGQGSHFEYKQSDERSINFNFATFWNDFSHYSIYDEAEPQKEEKEYRAAHIFSKQGLKEENLLFEEKEMYQDHPNDSFSQIATTKTQSSSDISPFTETLTIQPTSHCNLQIQAWLPEDFNLHIHLTKGDITGMNMKDTKLLSKRVHLTTMGQNARVSARRLRNDECTISTVDGIVTIGSYIETGVLKVRTEKGNVQIGKKLGIGKNGVIETKQGSIVVGSIFSKMAQLPEQSYDTKTLSHQIEQLKELPQSVLIQQGLLIKNSPNISIDSLHGLVSISNPQPNSTVNIQGVESGKLKLFTPQSSLRIGHLKSLHDTSYIECDSLDLTISEDGYEGFYIYDIKKGQYIDPIGKDMTETSEPKPTLYVNAHSGNIKFQIMSSFAILKRQIEAKVALRGAGREGERPSRKRYDENTKVIQ
ncbi:hypothetical protein FGO68_gene16007 [Halteria grandinella]|uniref:Adhesin domain-containing protein n=1 Tax=Halteria grandinella TaxID=5974 RepID=A0A8J8NPH9_HALGN|nr:hypothetical protein FGO68_gene16007 [Halteria grandinella]